MTQLIEDLKEAGQDFEFYPTTDEILSALVKSINAGPSYEDRRHSFSSFLDIGAGNGKVLKTVQKACDKIDKFYAIEKSMILLSSLPADICILGTDFIEQSLMTKNVDIVFCNPPYSEFQTWATKIIRESAAIRVYLVLPRRWKESRDIKAALDYRQATYKTLGEFSFEDAEDRTARAMVDLIRIDLSQEKDDAFDRFFNEEFAELKAKFNETETAEDQEQAAKEKDAGKFQSLVLGINYPARLVEMYNQELAHIRKNYALASQLDVSLLKEFDISPKRILECLKTRLSGLKNQYWNELISRMAQVTNRLTSKKRRQLLDTLHANGHVDLTVDNVYAVIMWILKNATQYIDEQLVAVYDQAIDAANVRNYKSNQRAFEFDRWRYNQDKPTHIFLDYRLVLTYCGRIERGYSAGYSLSENACEFIQDLLTVSRNLGFTCDTVDGRLDHWHKGIWEPGKPQTFRCIHKGVNEVLFEVKAHLNGNLHIRMNQKLALALNVEYGRLKGWLKSPQEAGEELSDTKAAAYYKSNVFITCNPMLMLGGETAEHSELKAAA